MLLMVTSVGSRRAFWLLAAGLLVVPVSAFAQGALPAKARAPDPVTTLTLDQVESFGVVVGETEAEVAETLFRHPEVIPVAAQAVEARTERKHTGKVLTVAGFLALGAGLTAAVLVMFSGPIICFDEECSHRQHEAQTNAEGIAIVGAALGLALAVPGFVKSAKDSDAEREAVRRYRAVKPDAAPPMLRDPTRRQAWSAVSPSTSLSLLTVRF